MLTNAALPAHALSRSLALARRCRRHRARVRRARVQPACHRRWPTRARSTMYAPSSRAARSCCVQGSASSALDGALAVVPARRGSAPRTHVGAAAAPHLRRPRRSCRLPLSSSAATADTAVCGTSDEIRRAAALARRWRARSGCERSERASTLGVVRFACRASPCKLRSTCVTTPVRSRRVTLASSFG